MASDVYNEGETVSPPAKQQRRQSYGLGFDSFDGMGMSQDSNRSSFGSIGWPLSQVKQWHNADTSGRVPRLPIGVLHNASGFVAPCIDITNSLLLPYTGDDQFLTTAACLTSGAAGPVCRCGAEGAAPVAIKVAASTPAAAATSIGATVTATTGSHAGKPRSDCGLS